MIIVPPTARDLLDLSLGEDGAGADHRPPSKPPGQPRDAVERIGRVHRNFDQRETGIDQRIADALDFVGLHPAQDGDERAARKGGVERGEHGSLLHDLVDTPATNAAWLSIR
jgi:hypothetical protein